MGLALESGETLGIPGDLGREDLDRHVAAELRVGGPVHLTHPPGPERLEDLVWAQASTWTEGHTLPLLSLREFHAAQQILKARIVPQAVELRLKAEIRQSGIAIQKGSLQPFDGTVVLPAEEK